MSRWSENRAAGKCGRCGKKKPAKGKSRCKDCADAVNAAVRKWDEDHPDQRQENRNAFWKTEAGKKAAARNNAKRNPLRSKKKPPK